MDDADIENKYDKVFTFAPGEGQHPLGRNFHELSFFAKFGLSKKNMPV